MISQIEFDLISAMKAGNVVERETLRMLKSAIKNAEIDKGSELTDEETITIIQKEVKRRNEAIEAFKTANKPELVEMETQEARVLQKYLPELMAEAEIRTKVGEYLSSNPATSADIGKVMGTLSAQLKGKADMGLVSKIVKESLQGQN